MPVNSGADQDAKRDDTGHPRGVRGVFACPVSFSYDGLGPGGWLANLLPYDYNRDGLDTLTRG